MKKLWSIIAVLVAIALIGILALALLRNPGRNIETWEDITESYVKHRGWVIEQAVKARAPGNFTEEMNLLTYANGPYYTVDETPNTSVGARPIPYPPEEVWCVLLKQRAAEENSYSIIFANLHQDMYNAEWIVHEGARAPFSQTFLECVASFGCDLKVSNLPQE